LSFFLQPEELFADLDEEFTTAPKKKPAAAGLAAKAAAAATQPKAAKGEAEVSPFFDKFSLN
jgi:hypothetical protein